ncbi:MAG: 16S rRNA (guanine(527)-N(7))-methyltransferase RsmG [Flavobacteriaceae bacterium]|nr:16S rRNA (guanine(527)-N(7))-methyltransferase RsmG [Flavobacteriaceae bacterium]
MQLINKYFDSLTENQIIQFEKLDSVYKDWNCKINVISRKDINDLYLKHVLHSLSIGKLIEFKENTSILDVGTGGGFPGIPLAILFPECKFHLVDSIKKKIKVVDNVVEYLELKNVTTTVTRAELIDHKFDFIISRAVTNMNDFVKWVKYKVNKKSNNSFKNGILYLKGGDLKIELMNFKSVKIYNLSEYYKEEFFNEKKIVYLPIKYKVKN